MDREKNSLAFKLQVPSSSCVATEDTLVIYSSTYKELPNFVIFPIENKENVKKGSPQKFPGQWQARGSGSHMSSGTVAMALGGSGNRDPLHPLQGGTDSTALLGMFPNWGFFPR